MAKLDFNQCNLTTEEMEEGNNQFAPLEADLPLLETISSENVPDDTYKSGDVHKTDDVCWYVNAATCPDCEAGMVRLGSCFCCQSCGYESCGG